MTNTRLADNIYDNCPFLNYKNGPFSSAEDEENDKEVDDNNDATEDDIKLPISEINFHQHNVWVPANPYLTERIPNWLYVYSRAPIELDSQLKWNLFGEEDLHFYLAMINRLYKEEAQELVLSYESFRAFLQKEIEQRESECDATDKQNIYNNVGTGDDVCGRNEQSNQSMRDGQNFNIYNNVDFATHEAGAKHDHHHYSNIAD